MVTHFSFSKQDDAVMFWWTIVGLGVVWYVISGETIEARVKGHILGYHSLPLWSMVVVQTGGCKLQLAKEKKHLCSRRRNRTCS